MMLRSILVVLSLVSALPATAAGNAEAGRSKAQVCVGCHGADGNAASPINPKLAGQHAGYLLRQLKNFKSGRRDNAIMKGQVANLSDQDMQDLAAYYAGLTMSQGAAPDAAKRQLGERIYRGGNETKGVAACMSCHSPNGAGNLPANFPVLGGQNEAYTSKTMKDFRDGKVRGADDKDEAAKTMHTIAKKMSDQEIEAVAHYIAGLH